MNLKHVGGLKLISRRSWSARWETISEIVSGKRGVSPETATGLGAAFGTTAELWLNLDAAYQLSKVDDSGNDGIARRAKLYSKAPIKDMIRRGWIDGSDDVSVLEEQLCRFLEIPSIDDEPGMLPHAARKSTSYDENLTESQLVWLMRAKKIARAVDVRSYSPRGLEDALSKLRLVRHQPQELRHVPRILSEAGIIFVVVQPFLGSRIDGACFWLDKHPVVAMSLRYDRIDNFWFVLMHELGHVKQGGLSTSIDVDLVGSHGSEDRTGQEREADDFAGNYLVPPDRLDDFISRVGPLYSAKKIEGFAKTLEVHPAIVVGQLQYRQEIGYASFRKMMVPVRDVVTAAATTDGWGNAFPPLY